MRKRTEFHKKPETGTYGSTITILSLHSENYIENNKQHWVLATTYGFSGYIPGEQAHISHTRDNSVNQVKHDRQEINSF